MPWATWTTRSPSCSSRKLSITRLSRRRAGRRRSVRRNNSPLLTSTIALRAPGGNRCAGCPRGNADAPRGPAACRRRSRPGARTSASVWQTRNTSCPRPASSNSSRTRPMSPLNRSTDSIGSRQVVSSEPAATAEAVTEGNRNTRRSTSATPWQSCGRSRRSSNAAPRPPSRPARRSRNQLPAAGNRPDGAASPRPREMATVRLAQRVLPALLDKPASGTSHLGCRSTCPRPRLPARFQATAPSRPPVQARQAPLAGDLESADRFDLVAEELDPDRVVPVGGEDVDDAAPPRELARQLDGRRVAGSRPGPASRESSSSEICWPTASERVCRAKRFPGGDRLDQGLNAGDERVRRRGPCNALSSRKRSPGASSWGSRSAESDSRTGNRSGRAAAEQGQVVDEPSTSSSRGQTTTSTAGACPASAAAASAQDDPRLRPKSPRGPPQTLDDFREADLRFQSARPTPAAGRYQSWP